MVARTEDSHIAEQRATSRSHQRSTSRYSIRERLTFVLALVVFAAASFYAGGAMLTRAYPALFPGENAPFSSALGRLPGPVKVEQPDAESVFNKRRNILIVGLDKRPDEPMLGEYRTDVIMVATIDPVYNSVNILSFPRDMYIEYQGPNGNVYKSRINASYERGISRGGTFEAGANALAEDLKFNFGIEIDNYVIMDFDGVSKLIDAIGGVDVTIPEDLAVYDWWYSDESGRRPAHYISFPPGPTHLNGYEAVAFGRNRTPSDLERIRRQQLVLQAAAAQAFDLGLLQDPMGVYNAYKDVVKHNFSAGQIPGIANMVREAQGKVNTFSVAEPVDGVPTMQEHTTETGAQVLLWNERNVQYWINQAFTEATYSASHVEIQNGYGPGGDAEVEKLGRWLRWEKGFPTVYQGPDADVQPHTSITVYDQERMPMGEDVAEWLGVPESRLRTAFDTESEVDMLIVIGQDFEVPGTGDELASQGP